MDILASFTRAAEAVEAAARMRACIDQEFETFQSDIRRAQEMAAAFAAEHTASLERVGVAMQAAALYWRDEAPLERELFLALADRGWAGLENQLAADCTLELLEGLRENGGDWLDAEICSEARADGHAAIKHIVGSWWDVPYLAVRRAIIDDAVRAHEEGRYTLSIPALMPLVDGLTADIVGAEVRLTGRGMCAKRAAKMFGRENEELWSTALLTVVDRYAFQRYTFDSDIAPSTLNRHGIVHGRISGYGTEANSFRTILLIDIFARFARERRGRRSAAPSNAVRQSFRANEV